MAKLLVFAACILTNCNAIIEVFFSPDGNVGQKFVQEIDKAKRTLHGAIYTLTDQKIADAFVRAAARGVEVSLIVDRNSVESAWSKCKFLIQNKVNVFIRKNTLERMLAPRTQGILDFFTGQSDNRGKFNFAPLMHHKYLVFDKLNVWTGSFNWTVSATKKNDENAIFIQFIPMVASSYLENFAGILAESASLSLTALGVIAQNRSANQITLSKGGSTGSGVPEFRKRPRGRGRSSIGKEFKWKRPTLVIADGVSLKRGPRGRSKRNV